MITSNQNILDIVQLPEISREDKQLTILSTDEVIIDDFISFNMSTKGSLYQRNMKYCEVVLSGKYELTSKWINIKRFIASDLVDNGNLQEIDYGDFGVLKSEYDDTTKRTKLICYDRMLQAQIPYDSEVMNLTYPMTISQVLNRLAIVCKLDLVANTVNNLYQVIHSDLWANQSFTYADVLDHIAQATTSIISIRNNKLEIFNPIENDFTIQGKFYSLKIGEPYGKTNIVNVSQEPQHYNKFAPSSALDIPLEDRKELAFSNNPILNQDMQTWADRLYLQTKDLEYATFESSTIGYGIFEVGDMVDVYEAGEDVIHRVMITNETFDFKHALTTEIGSNLPMVHKNQYVVETDQARQGQTTYLIVDQLNGVIEALVQKVDDEADKTAQLTIRVDEIDLKVSNISNGNIIGNFNPENYLGWEGGSRLLYVAEYSKLRYLNGLTYAMGFQPVRMAGSLSEWGLSFFNNGSATSPFGYVVPTENYSYKARVQRFKPFSIDLLEYKDMITPFHKSTKFTFNNPQAYVQFTSALDPETVFVRIKFNVTGVTPSDRLEITENMYNRGLPKEYFVSGTEALVYAQSNIQVLSDGIKLNSEAVDTLSNDIHNAGVEINAINGVTTYGKKFEVMSEDRSTSYMKVTDNGVESHKMTAVDMIATNATIESGKIAGFDITGNDLAGSDIGLRPNEVSIGSSTMYKSSADDYELVIEGGGISIQTGSDKVARIRLGSHVFAQEFTSLGVVMNTVHRMLPIETTGTSAIGGATRRYEYIYLQNQPNVSSDTRYKSSIEDIDPILLEIIHEEVKPKTYNTIYDDKKHFGYIAQDVERALYKYCLQSSVLNGMDKLEASRFANTQISQFAVLSKSESYMSLLYGEMEVIMNAYHRRENKRLKDRLNNIESKLELLLQKEGK